MEEMLRLMASQPPWCPENHERWAVIDLEHNTLSGPYGKDEGYTLTYLYNTRPESHSRVIHAR